MCRQPASSCRRAKKAKTAAIGKKKPEPRLCNRWRYFENPAHSPRSIAARSSSRDRDEKGIGKVKLVILQISSDPTLTKSRTRVKSKTRRQSAC